MATASLASNGYRIAKSWQYNDPLPATPVPSSPVCAGALLAADGSGSSGSEEKPLLVAKRNKALAQSRYLTLLWNIFLLGKKSYRN